MSLGNQEAVPTATSNLRAGPGPPPTPSSTSIPASAATSSSEKELAEHCTLGQERVDVLAHVGQAPGETM